MIESIDIWKVQIRKRYFRAITFCCFSSESSDWAILEHTLSKHIYNKLSRFRFSDSIRYSCNRRTLFIPACRYRSSSKWDCKQHLDKEKAGSGTTSNHRPYIGTSIYLIYNLKPFQYTQRNPTIRIEEWQQNKNIRNHGNKLQGDFEGWDGTSSAVKCSSSHLSSWECC